MISPSILSAIQNELETLKSKRPDLKSLIDQSFVLFKELKKNLKDDADIFLSLEGSNPLLILQKLIIKNIDNSSVENTISEHLKTLLNLGIELQRSTNWSKQA